MPSVFLENHGRYTIQSALRVNRSPVVHVNLIENGPKDAMHPPLEWASATASPP